MVLFDTNAILRYIVYVLLKVYGVERKVIAQTVSDLSELDNIVIAEKNVVKHALKTFASTALDFVDCLLAGYAKLEQYTVFTFDKNLQKYLNK